MKIIMNHKYENLISIENLLLAWKKFIMGKKSKKDAQEFQLRLMDNILSLHADLRNGAYRHGGYQEFKVYDPKPRTIHKATVRDRLLHHAVYRILYPFFQKTFIADSFSCQNYKGIHKALKRFLAFGRIVSNNNTQTCWILKCDIRKFFHSIDQQILLKMLDERISDKRIVGLLQEIIISFNSGRPHCGLPLGNLTSQLFCNIYTNEFDQFVKHALRIKYYIRYADDFVIFSGSKNCLEKLILLIAEFLEQKLKLILHPNKIYIKTLSSGMDFLGWVHFFDHRVLRNTTRRKMFRKLKENSKSETISSYFGLLKHGNTGKIKERIINLSL
ncbi:MAG: hypothetical protein A3C58_02600 [Candidatus Staskawiczbacteria bacterium RIFCSPHIGHO2_02_FULL_34_10]|uniref:Reverse transcriptase domain-containing protein n=1 Tax=Candidatus Staskawiczbacteria bacterium RIFCSPHIGHO2_02_FULL_34_10 TaxID=1802205 RepID=A0A1G2HVL6_9BACT|nr:MAG: hypothetical protein A3C58_02600 [Candidatus Staskawiczbacteria bacterium RIFCSPHIGHO2_02_FULL_34_10]